jgi:uncharacterized peroxidase-related enzyme
MFLASPPDDPAGHQLREQERRGQGYVSNLTQLWSWHAQALRGYVTFRSSILEGATLSEREIAILVCATACARRDSYCALAWGKRLAAHLGDEATARFIATGDTRALSSRERALAGWAGQVVADPNAITPADIAALRAAGLSDREIFDATALVAARLAFSTVNDALGALPDAELRDAVPGPVRRAVDFGRPISPAPQTLAEGTT